MSCPQCGATKYWQDPRNKDIKKCKFCDTVYNNNEAKVEENKPKKDKIPARDNAKAKNSSVPTEISFVLTVISLMVLGGFCYFLYTVSNQAKINTVGEYEVPYMYCEEEVKVDFGFPQEPPLLTSAVGSIWVIPVNIKTVIEEERISTLPYLRLTCNFPDNEIFASQRVPIPENGQKITMRDG